MKKEWWNYQRFLLPSAAFLALCAISFRFDPNGTNWIWHGYPFIPLLIVLITFALVGQWIKIERVIFNPFSTPSSPHGRRGSHRFAFELILSKLSNMKKRNLFLGLAAFFGLSCLVFSFDDHSLSWAWKNHEWVPVILGTLALLSCFASTVLYK